MECPATDRPVRLQAAGHGVHTATCTPLFLLLPLTHCPAPQRAMSVCQRLSLLELVLDEESVSMVLRRMSPAAGTSSGDLADSVVDALIQGWSQICSSEGRSEGRRARHHLISCWHSGEESDTSGG